MHSVKSTTVIIGCMKCLIIVAYCIDELWEMRLPEAIRACSRPSRRAKR